ncbi:MAG: hypothetical protein OER86_08805 [Phycisphaerae bacterium]|nr:hypothetical protein [Phycisphaerae bacterium]
MMTCRELIEFLLDYHEQRLPDSQRTEFEKHLVDCPCCKHYLDSYRETVHTAQSVCRGQHEPPADMPEQLVQAILAARNQ